MRGQGSLEYLLMYGFVLIVITIIGLALWRMGVFSPLKKEMVLENPQHFEIYSFSLEKYNLVLQIGNTRLGSSAKISSIKVGGRLHGERRFSKTLTMDSFNVFRIPLNEDCEKDKFYEFKVYIYYNKERPTGGFSSIENVDTARLLVKCKEEIVYVEPGWLAGFKYRVPITITQNTGNDLSDYQISFSINTQSLIEDGKMNGNCSDIRVTDSDGETVLPYWIEEGTCNTTNTIIWVKVPSIPDGINKVIYLYYGNPTAEDLSNGTTVFEFFDDFSEYTIGTLWEENIVGGSVDIDTANSRLYLSASNNQHAGVIAEKTFSSSNLIFEAKMTELNDLLYEGYAGIYILDFKPSGDPYSTREWYRMAFKDNGDIIESRKNTDTGQGVIRNTDSYTHGTYYKFGIALDSTSGLTKFFKDDANYGSTSLDFETSDNIYLEIFTYDKGECYVDWIRVRKYVYPEPSVVIGEEEVE